MPPKRSDSWLKSADQEGKILLALDDIKNGRIQSIRAAARLYNLPHTTLADRAKGVLARVERRLTSYKLTQLEEDSIVE